MGDIINSIGVRGTRRAITIDDLLARFAMYVCPQCSKTFEESKLDGSAWLCPSCGAARAESDPAWVSVARVANLAEAGFLTDELIGLGIEAQIHQTHDFSALTDRWSTQYLIRVPADAARDAASRIREYLADDAGQDEESFRLLGGPQPLDQALWRPVALVVLAGVTSFVLGQRFSEQQNGQDPNRRPQRNELQSAMAAIDRPFVTESAPGQPAHRLRFDRQRQAWLLDTDHDGDGRYDSREAFHASGAGW